MRLSFHHDIDIAHCHGTVVIYTQASQPKDWFLTAFGLLDFALTPQQGWLGKNRAKPCYGRKARDILLAVAITILNLSKHHLCGLTADRV